MKRIEEFFSSEFGRSWLAHDDSTHFTGRKKYYKGKVIEVEIEWTKHFFLPEFVWQAPDKLGASRIHS